MDWERPIVQENFSKRFGAETDSGITGPNPNQYVDCWVSLRKGKYKYVRTLVEDEIEELYDIDSDPRELVNLALNDSYSRILDTYREELLAELRRMDAGFVDNMPKPRTDRR